MAGRIAGLVSVLVLGCLFWLAGIPPTAQVFVERVFLLGPITLLLGSYAIGVFFYPLDQEIEASDEFGTERWQCADTTRLEPGSDRLPGDCFPEGDLADADESAGSVRGRALRRRALLRTGDGAGSNVVQDQLPARSWLELTAEDFL